MKLHEWKQEIYSNIVFSKDNKLLIASVKNQGTTFWDVETRKEVRRLLKEGPSATALALSPNGKLLVTGNSWGTIRLWDVDSGKEVRPRKQQQK